MRDYANRLLWLNERETASTETIKSALAVLEAKARFESPCHPLHYRVAWHNGALWIDLGDEAWRAVKVTAEGWEIVPSGEVPILFRRYSHMAPLPLPEDGPGIEGLRELLPLGDEDAWDLVRVWLVTAFLPDIPRPGIILHGLQGAGKSTVAEILRQIVDPSQTPLNTLPKDHENLVQILAHHFLPTFDNLRSLPSWASDDLCIAVTGGGFSKRQLYTDEDDVIFKFCRPFILTGIDIRGTSPDLLDRSIILHIDRIPKEARRPKRQIFEQFEAARPSIFKQILDSLVYCLGNVEKTAEKLKDLPRMADWAIWGTRRQRPWALMAKDSNGPTSVTLATSMMRSSRPIWLGKRSGFLFWNGVNGKEHLPSFIMPAKRLRKEIGSIKTRRGQRMRQPLVSV